MKVIALMPMKGHSERVRNKNIRLFSGKPLYHYMASILQESDMVESIFINTDSDFIAQEVPKYFPKVKIIERPHKIRGDFVPMNDIIAYDLSVVEGEHFLQTHSTNPLLTRQTLEAAIQMYFQMNEEYDSIFSVTRWQTRMYWESGEPVNHNPAELLRTQDLPPLFEENSNIYLFSRTSFEFSNNRRIGMKPKMYAMDPLEAIDIDNEETFQLAEAMFALKKAF